MKSSKTGSWAGCIFLILCLGLAGSQAFALYEPEQITPNVQSDGTPFFLAENSTIRMEWNGVNAGGADVINGYIFAWSTSSEPLSDTVLNYESVSGEDDDTSANNGTLKSTTFAKTFFVEKPRSFFEADDSNLFRYFHLKTWYIENGTTIKYSSDIVTGPINVDTIAPSGTISLVDLQGQAINATTSTNVLLNISAGLDPLKMFLNEDQIRPNESIDFASQATYSLKNATTGTKTIYAWFQDEAGNISDSPATDSIELLGAVIKPNTGSFDLNQGTQAFTVDNSNALYDWTIFNATAETQNATVVSLNGTVNGTNSVNVTLLNSGTFQLQAVPSAGGTILQSKIINVVSSTLNSIDITTVSGGMVNTISPKVGETVQFLATGNYTFPGEQTNASTNEDLTTVAMWNSTNETVGSLDSTGLFKGLAQGTTNVTATYQGTVSNILQMQVQAPEKVVFDSTILPDAIHPDKQVDYGTAISGGTGAGFTYKILSQPTIKPGQINANGIFTVDTNKSFAGNYIIQGKDISSLETVTHTLKIPMQLAPEHFTMRSDMTPKVFQISGAPIGTSFNATIKTQQDTVKNYGYLSDVNATGHFSYTPNVNATDIFRFKFKLTANDSFLANANLDSLLSGNMTVMPMHQFTGTLEGNAVGALSNATVQIIQPDQFKQLKQTKAQGTFDFNLPHGNTYIFQAWKKGFLPKFFTSVELMQNSTQTLYKADAYIKGMITKNGNSLNATNETAKVYVTYSDAETKILPASGKPLHTNEMGHYSMDFSDPGAQVSTYRVIASLPDYLGSTQINQWSPQKDNVIVDLMFTNSTKPDIGGIFSIEGPFNATVGQVDIPPEAVETNGTGFTVNSERITNNSKLFQASGNFLYKLNVTDTDEKSIKTFANPIQITLPFDLDLVESGQFEDGTYRIFHADTLAGLLAGNGQAVDASDILAVDYLGDGTQGFVTFEEISLSVFGIGTSAGGGNGTDDKCFIATAAFGSLMHPQVQVLRDFRDNFLLSNLLGRTFVKVYYKYSPPLAEFISKHKFLRNLVRWSLLPLAGLCKMTLQIGLYWSFLSLLCSLALLTIAFMFFFRFKQRLI